MVTIGIDVGSTTVKIVVLDENENIIYNNYQRHFSKVREKAVEILESIPDELKAKSFKVAITGSAGLGIASAANIAFVQEVFATQNAVKRFYPTTDAVIELGGEDAKIIFLTNGLEERMNGSCAGGTGSFIDQMASLLDVSADDVNDLAAKHTTIYSIASRCGVFAKTDIQPLLNQGAKKEDISASILQAVVDQTIGGLAQGREITGNVMFLGGPLSFMPSLRQRFIETLKLDEKSAILPPSAELFIAMGAALYAKNSEEVTYANLVESLKSAQDLTSTTNTLPALFENETDYEEFAKRHKMADVKRVDIKDFMGDAYLGIDAGSTTTKMALISKNGDLIYSYYASNKGNPVEVVRAQLSEIYKKSQGKITIRGAAATGYGEDLIKAAFNLDFGLVETVAHYTAAAHFNPNVDFIIDIGGQDMKCFKIRSSAIDSIMLNEACSSGCGSFIETFAKALDYDAKGFAAEAIKAKSPVDLGSRCTVFMNSSVKQAQKEGASVQDISAGLSISVVKNALYKVIRATSADDVGRNIVVQGGTFLNDAVLRSFEMELNREVIRPEIAGLMGAFGAALYAKENANKSSTIINNEDLKKFEHTSKPVVCKACPNNCQMTVNTFFGGAKFTNGNRCEKGAGAKKAATAPNMYKIKYEYLRKLESIKPAKPKGKIGIPLGLNMYENLPFWHAFFLKLGYEIVLNEESSRKMYSKGQHTIPSDTVCYPAKLLHGAVFSLLEQGVNTIFYPCMPYNFDEGRGDNNYNCPVVAYYPELLAVNVQDLKSVKYLNPYLGPHRKKDFIKRAPAYFCKHFNVSEEQVKTAIKSAFMGYTKYTDYISSKCHEIIAKSRAKGMIMVVLGGRPYHIDPEISHGIDDLVAGFNIAVLTEDAVAAIAVKTDVKVLNQWTYHSRLYDAAGYAAKSSDMEYIQLVSFGCGLDAISTDEVRDILEAQGKLYTQLKIDEIYNLGAVKIRIRSLLAALEAKKKRGVSANESA